MRSKTPGLRTPTAVQDSGNPIGRHLEPPAKLGRAHAKLRELLGQMFSWVNRAACHIVFPARIDNLDIDVSGPAVRSFETYAPRRHYVKRNAARWW